MTNIVDRHLHDYAWGARHQFKDKPAPTPLLAPPLTTDHFCRVISAPDGNNQRCSGGGEEDNLAFPATHTLARLDNTHNSRKTAAPTVHDSTRPILGALDNMPNTWARRRGRRESVVLVWPNQRC